MSNDVEVPAHELDFPDAQGEFEFTKKLVGQVASHIHKVTTNLGADFDFAMDLLGFAAALQRPAVEVVEAARSVAEIGVALFQRGSVGPDVTVTLSLAGTTVDVQGGVNYYNSAPRWLRAMGAAMALRDRAAIESLSRFDPGDFEGKYDPHHDMFVRALVALHRNDAAVGELLATAQREAQSAKLFPELARRIDMPLIGLAQAIVAGNADHIQQHLVEGLTWYRAIHQRKGASHYAQAMVPLRFVGLCALAHDRGLPVHVRSRYLPSCLVDGNLDGA
ncbi:immunity 49 family protein [Nannocystaceae bacterium ST9]